jgi:hypothetical protein
MLQRFAALVMRQEMQETGPSGDPTRNEKEPMQP